MSGRSTVLLRLQQTAADPRWRADRTPLVRETLAQLAAFPDDLLDVLLGAADPLREAAYECLAELQLPDSTHARLQSVVMCAHDIDQVAWSLHVLARNEHTGPIPASYVERALRMGGAARGAAISAIPFVDADREYLESWLLEIFEAGESSECLRVAQAAPSVSWAFAAKILERASRATDVELVCEALYLVWYADLDRTWTVGVLRAALVDWPMNERILRPALYCIADRHLQEFEDVALRSLAHTSPAIAFQAGEVVARVFPARVAECLNSPVTQAAALEALRSFSSP